MKTSHPPEKAADRFLQILGDRELLDDYELNQIRNEFRSHPAIEVLNGLARSNRLGRKLTGEVWSEVIGMAHVDPLTVIIEPEAARAIPAEIARQVKVIGLHRFADTLTVAMASAHDPLLVARLEKITGCPVSPVFSLPGDIDDAIALHYREPDAIADLLKKEEWKSLPAFDTLDDHQVAELAQSTPVIRLLEAVLLFALRDRGTDIHFQPQESHGLLRVRIDGRLQTVARLPVHLGPALVSRVKILCKLDISERRLPQDGRFSFSLGNHSAHFRVSTLPGIHGEKVVIRILTIAGQKGVLSLDRMHVSRAILDPLRRIISHPNGVFFVTGPTGSGKTTTLYAALEEINKPHTNIVTIEDPVEYQLENITQVQINRAAGLTFATVLRSVLRQDPDVILLGEIRDLETARIAAEAALTGHLVFATLHTNSAVQAIVRLVDMGVEPFMLAPSMIGVLSQRLVARICEHCREPVPVSTRVLEKYFYDADQCGEILFYRGAGCPECRNTGYHGRVAIHELVIISEEMRAMISRGASNKELNEAARRNGTRPLRYDGLRKVLLGLTTIEEVERVTPDEWSS